VTLAAGDSLRQASDQQLETALRDAELPSLMPALAYLTGDMSLAGGDLRPPVTGPSVVVAPQGGMTPPPARREDQQALLTCMTGDVDDRYLPMLAFELGLPRAGTAPGAGDGDTDAPGWTKPALARSRPGLRGGRHRGGHVRSGHGLPAAPGQPRLRGLRAQRRRRRRLAGE